MNASLLCLMVALASPPDENGAEPIYRPSPAFTAAIRGQTPAPKTFQQEPNGSDRPYEELPAPGGEGGTQNGQPDQSPPTLQTPGQQAPPSTLPAPTQPGLPFSAPPIYDPFLGQPGAGQSPGQGLPDVYSFSIFGPQRYRFGWTPRAEVHFITDEDVSGMGSGGDFGVFGLDTEFEHTSRTFGGWILSLAPQFGLRSWDGPAGPISLPGNVFRFGGDIELTTPPDGDAWTAQFTFSPSWNSDFEETTSSDAWNWDGRGIVFYRHSRRLLWAFGVGFWDRVEDRVIPYAGAVWKPNRRWTWNLVLPEPRVSYLLGCHGGVSKSLYVRGKYNVEAYEVEIGPPGMRRQDKLELSDWRLTGGLKVRGGTFSTFIEAGWVFGRETEFLRGGPAFDISSGFLGQIGLQF